MQEAAAANIYQSIFSRLEDIFNTDSNVNDISSFEDVADLLYQSIDAVISRSVVDLEKRDGISGLVTAANGSTETDQQEHRLSSDDKLVDVETLEPLIKIEKMIQEANKPLKSLKATLVTEDTTQIDISFVPHDRKQTDVLMDQETPTETPLIKHILGNTVNEKDQELERIEERKLEEELAQIHLISKRSLHDTVGVINHIIHPSSFADFGNDSLSEESLVHAIEAAELSYDLAKMKEVTQKSVSETMVIVDRIKQRPFSRQDLDLHLTTEEVLGSKRLQNETQAFKFDEELRRMKQITQKSVNETAALVNSIAGGSD